MPAPVADRGRLRLHNIDELPALADTARGVRVLKFGSGIAPPTTACRIALAPMRSPACAPCCCGVPSACVGYFFVYT